MIVILGAGISGLMLANRLRTAGRKFVILDKAGIMASGNDQGFFYAHEPNPFTRPESFKIISDACPDGTVEKYAMKVYGDPNANLDTSSFARFGKAGKMETGQGWQYDQGLLCSSEIKSCFQKAEIDVVDLDTQMVFDTQGRCWKYSSLLSTIPLPLLTHISIHNNSPISKFIRAPKFKHRSIFLYSHTIEDQSYGEMRVHYCASDCHHWYRKVITHNPGYTCNEAQEHISNPGVHGRTLFPGKIWLEDEEDKRNLQRLESFLAESNVTLFGRYGSWKPKQLTSHVWAESASLGESLP